jgi:hypothetical protein
MSLFRHPLASRPAMRRGGTRAKHAGVPLHRIRAVEGAGRLFSTPSRPALRAASGRPPARQRHDGHRGAALTVQASRRRHLRPGRHVVLARPGATSGPHTTGSPGTTAVNEDQSSSQVSRPIQGAMLVGQAPRFSLARRKPGVQIPSPPPHNSPGHRPGGSPPPGRDRYRSLCRAADGQQPVSVTTGECARTSRVTRSFRARVRAPPPGLRPPSARLARYPSKLLDPVEDVVDGRTPYGD